MENLLKKDLWKLRKEIVLNSLFLNNYENTYGIDEKELSCFFDGYLEELEYLMKETITDYNDTMFFEYIEVFDTEENLYEYYLTMI